jgi:uncharacterized membrane protein YfcA
MLVTLFGIVMGAVIFSALGSVVLARVPAFRYSTANLVLFVVGAFVGFAISTIAYGEIFGERNSDDLTGTWTVAGVYVAMFVGAVGGGSGLVWLSLLVRKQPRTTSTIPKRNNSSSPN